MALSFYPYDEDVEGSGLKEQLEIVMEAVERYKAAVLDVVNTATEVHKDGMVPRDMKLAINWQVLSKLMREIREQTEATVSAKAAKAAMLKRLAEIYEVLRAAKMPKLEAVRIALVNEANHLGGGASGTQVA